MKIYDVNVTGGAATEAGRAQETHRAAGQVSASSSSTVTGDRIELSGALSSLGRALSSDSGSRAARVQTLAAQYRSGIYQVDSLATSRAMVAGALTPEAQ